MDIMFNELKLWLVEQLFPVIIILTGVLLARKAVFFGIKMFEKRFKTEGVLPSEKEKRMNTLSGLLSTTLSVMIYVVGFLMILSQLGIQIGPVLAAAGVAGIAIGFGAQTLVKDLISGFFILMEDQVRVGDVVNVAGIGGLVEAVNLRTTRLRDLEGRVHIIPNGSIEVATNFTKDWSRALVEIGVAYKENVDHVIEVLNEVGEGLKNDEAFSDFIVEPLTILGVDSFGESSVNIRMFFKTKPLKQWDVAREFRKRIKRAFDEKGIEIPFPHRTLYIGEGKSKGVLKVDAFSEHKR